MNRALSLTLSAFCLVVVIITLNVNHKRLDTATTAVNEIEAEDDSDLESLYTNESKIPGNGDENEPSHAPTVASEGELAVLDARSEALLDKAEAYLKANPKKFTNPYFITAIDFTLHSSKKRMYVQDLRSGVVLSYHVAHGSGSDPMNTGTPTKFSNVPGSNASSVGYYRVSETYYGKNGLSVRLDGLSSTNSNARKRAVVIHGARYVYDDGRKAGRSWGCPAISFANYKEVINRLKGGSVLYIEGK